MARNYIVFPFAALIALFIASCKCGTTCPAFDADYQSYLPYAPGQLIRYTNGQGGEITVAIASREASEEYQDKGGHDEFGACMEPRCRITGELTGTANTSRNGRNDYRVSLESSEDNGAGSDLRLMDFHQGFSLNEQYASLYGDTVLPSVTLGSRSYQQVLQLSTDTVSNPAQGIWQVYFSKDGGVLGFRDRQTHSLYYLN